MIHLFHRLGNYVRVSLLSITRIELSFSHILLYVPVIHVLRTCFLFAHGLLNVPLILSSHSVQRGGRVEIIANDQGHRITPSWVSFTDEERL